VGPRTPSLDGRIDNSFYARMSERLEQDKLMQEIIQHQEADRSYINEGVRLIELAHDAQRLFLSRSGANSVGSWILYFRTRPGRTER